MALNRHRALQDDSFKKNWWVVLPLILIALGAYYNIRKYRSNGVFAVGMVISTSTGPHQRKFVQYEYFEKGRQFVREDMMTDDLKFETKYYLVILDSTDPQSAFILLDKPLFGPDIKRDWRSIEVGDDLVSLFRL